MPKREDCYVCEALLKEDGTCSNDECTSHPCLQCRQKTCDCPPLTASEKIALRVERDRENLTKALVRAANERLFPTKVPTPSVKQFKDSLVKRPKVTRSERRARADAQFNERRWPKDN